MTYLGFLALFLVLPLAAMGLLTVLDARRNPAWFTTRTGKLAAVALLAHVAIALAYTTPWDNYLVATRVWWYDPSRVLGVTLGWVPLEEYFFIILQTCLTGLVLLALVRRLSPMSSHADRPALRFVSALTVMSVWLASVAMLASGWRPATYLGLELAWVLLPMALQLAVGADILWRHRRAVLLAVASVTLFLCAADFLAIGSGVWTINPAQSLNVFIGGVLPIEEVVFFLLTNVLIAFGLTLALAPETWARAAQFRVALRGALRVALRRRESIGDNA